MMPPDRKIVADSSAAAAASAGSNQIQPHEDEGDDRGGEDLEEAFHPQMHHPPAPVFDHRQMRVLSPGQTGAIEQGDRGRRHRNSAQQAVSDRPASAAPASSTRTIRNSQSNRPTNKADLPDSAQIDVLVTLMAEIERDRVGQLVVNAQPFAGQRTDHDHASSAPNSMLTPKRCPFGSWSLTSGPMNKPGGEPRRGDPEHAELHVPGPRHAVRQPLATAECRRSRRLRRRSAP